MTLSMLYVWAGRSFEKRGRCRTCKQPFKLLTRFDTGKMIPVRLDARKLSTQTQEGTGRHYDVYSWADVHRCPKKDQPVLESGASE
jgi:hypothetical protein